MPIAKKTKSGKFRCQVAYRENGKLKNKQFTADTKKDAEALAYAFRTKKKIHIDKTVAEGINEYISLREAVASPSTIKGYRSMERSLNKEFPELLKKSTSDFTENDLQKIISDSAAKRSPKTVKNRKTLLCNACKDFKAFEVTMPQTIKYEPIIPTKDEIKAFLDAEKGTELEIPIMLGAFCMMRRGEIMALTMEDINFKNQTIHIKHCKVMDDYGNWRIKPPKNFTSDRVIKVPKFVLDTIKKRGYICKLNPDDITRNFLRHRDRLGLSKFRLHDLRHYAVSVFHDQGIPIAYVQKYGGWSNIDTPTRIYQHCLRDKEDAYMNKMTSYFEESHI